MYNFTVIAVRMHLMSNTIKNYLQHPQISVFCIATSNCKENILCTCALWFLKKSDNCYFEFIALEEFNINGKKWYA